MKKGIGILLGAMLIFSLCACGGTNESAEESAVSTAVIENTQLDETTVSAEVSQENTIEETIESTLDEEGSGNEDAEEAVSITETDYMSIDGIFVDESFVDDESDSLRMVYLFYSATTPGENLRVDSKSAKLTIGEVNTYDSEHYPGVCRYMSSYYYSDYLEDIYVGDSLKVVETFKIPAGDLTEGKALTLEKHQIPDTEKIKLSTDDIVFCESVEAIAEMVDPEGYELEVYNRSAADEGTAAAVQAAINGYYWSAYVNSTSYEIEFYSPNSFEMRVKALGVANSGTYEVQNGYVVCTYTDTGLVLEIPYSWGANDIDLDVVTALDVGKG